MLQAPLFAGAPVSLDTVRVVDHSACRVRPDSAAATFAVWEQIRTALIAAQLTAGGRTLGVTAVTYQRSQEPTGRVLQQHARLRSGVTGRPWRSVSPDSLQRAGYVVTERNGATTYFAPDLDVLTSEQFSEDHCFRLVSVGANLGIAFEPTRERRRLPEIQGTLSLDRATSELRRLDFRYVNLTREQESVAAAELEFLRLPQGSWLISRWRISAPVIETRYVSENRMQATARVAGRSVREVHVEGGDLALVTRNQDTLWSRPPLTLDGTVRDSSSSAGIQARVALRGTGLVARTDSAGNFRIAGVLPGEYMVDIATAALEEMGVTHSVPLAFTDSAAAFAARVPSADQMVHTMCGSDTSGMVFGKVRVHGDSTPPRNVRVIIGWNRFARGASDLVTVPHWAEATTDGFGRFRVCNVRRNTPVTVRAESGPGAARPLAIRIPLDRQYMSVEIVLDPAAPRLAVLSGVVLSDVNGQPIVGAEVALHTLAKNTHTNEEGAFRLSDIPPGPHEVMVRRVGYQPVTIAMTFEPGRTVERRLLLSRVLVLDTVSVRASARLEEFERNRAMGMGHFLTRTDFEKQEHRDLGEILAQVPGAAVRRSATNAYIGSRRAAATSLALESQSCDFLKFESREPAPKCGCYAQVYVDGLLLYGGGMHEAIPDINAFPASWIEAIEFYAGPAQTPARYSRLNAQCGVLAIHTRRTP